LQGILAVYEQFKGDDKKKFEEAYSAAYTPSKVQIHLPIRKNGLRL
jgi:hypothetical protein